MASKLSEKTIPISRMDCPTCIPLLEKEIQHLKGVKDVRGNYINKTLKVTFNPAQVQLEAIESVIERVGYRIAYKKYPSPLSKLKKLFIRNKIEKITTLTDIDFLGKVLHTARPVVVLFYSLTCPSCRFFTERFTELQMKVTDKANFYKMDITSTETWQKYEIQSIPTVLVFRNGRLSERFEALPNIDEIARVLLAS